MAIIEAHSLYKNYGKVEALKSVSLSVEQGQCYALLGKNGAGKTTFVKSLLNLVNFKKGTLKLLGHDVAKKESRNHVAYLPEKFSFYPYYTLAGVCEFYGQMKGLGGDELKQSVGQAMERLGISDLMHKKVKDCSKGQLQRTGLAATLIGKNELFILDEPYSGLDPIGIKELQDLLKELSSQGKTLFINSHGLDSVEKVCDTVAIIDKGEMVVQGKLKELIGESSLLDFFYAKVGKHES
jgi:ABC-type multidrug transport system ATPase subunit